MAVRCWRQPWTILSPCARARSEIIVPAGNSYQSRTHANAGLAAGEQAESHLVRAGGRPHAELPGTLDGRANVASLVQASVRVTPPGCAPLALDGDGRVRHVDGRRRQAALRSDFSRTGLPQAPLAPARCWHLRRRPASMRTPPRPPAGTGRSTFRNDGLETLVFDAYIERDDVPIGICRTGRAAILFHRRDRTTLRATLDPSSMTRPTPHSYAAAGISTAFRRARGSSPREARA